MMKKICILLGALVFNHIAFSQTSFGVHWGTAVQSTPVLTLMSVANNLQNNNVNWIRSEINWHDIDTAQGAPYKWGQLVTNTDSLKARGFNIIGMLRGTPKWYTTNTTTISANDQYYAPQDTVHWVRFIDSVLNKLNGKVSYWELWNEEDNTYFIAPPNGKARKYFHLLRSGYHKIKAMHPGDKVLPGGFTSRMIIDRKAFADSLFMGSMQTQNYFDFMNFHMYEKAASYKNYITSANISKPVFITETNPWRVLGWNGGNSEINTANYLCTWIKDTLITDFNPSVICWFNLRNWVTQNQVGVCDNCNPDSTAYGLFNSVFNPTSVLTAYKNCLNTITNELERPLDINTVSFYPNPVIDQFSLTTLSKIEWQRVVVNDVYGKEVFRTEQPDLRAIDCSSWSPGVYVLSLTHNKGIKNIRFIKSN